MLWPIYAVGGDRRLLSCRVPPRITTAPLNGEGDEQQQKHRSCVPPTCVAVRSTRLHVSSAPRQGSRRWRCVDGDETAGGWTGRAKWKSFATLRLLWSPWSDAQHKNAPAVCGLCLAGSRDWDVCHWAVAEGGSRWSRAAKRWPPRMASCDLRLEAGAGGSGFRLSECLPRKPPFRNGVRSSHGTIARQQYRHKYQGLRKRCHWAG